MYGDFQQGDHGKIAILVDRESDDMKAFPTQRSGTTKRG